MVEARFTGKSEVLFLSITGDCHQQHASQVRLRSQLAGHLEPVHCRQSDVQQNDLRLVVLSRLKGLPPRVADINLMTCNAQQQRQAVSRVFIVVYHEDSPLVAGSDGRWLVRRASVRASVFEQGQMYGELTAL